jgi:hypothetical protein
MITNIPFSNLLIKEMKISIKRLENVRRRLTLSLIAMTEFTQATGLERNPVNSSSGQLVLWSTRHLFGQLVPYFWSTRPQRVNLFLIWSTRPLLLINLSLLF